MISVYWPQSSDMTRFILPDLEDKVVVDDDDDDDDVFVVVVSDNC